MTSLAGCWNYNDTFIHQTDQGTDRSVEQSTNLQIQTQSGSEWTQRTILLTFSPIDSFFLRKYFPAMLKNIAQTI